MLIRAHELELEKMKDNEEVNPEKREALLKAVETAEKAHKELADYLEEKIDYEVVPIKKLVSIQLECGIIMAEYLKGTC